MSIKIISEKTYKVQVEILQEVLINFTEIGITKYQFEKLPFKEKTKIINKYAKVENDSFEQYTDIQVMSRQVQ